MHFNEMNTPAAALTMQQEAIIGPHPHYPFPFQTRKGKAA